MELLQIYKFSIKEEQSKDNQSLRKLRFVQQDLQPAKCFKNLNKHKIIALKKK